MVALLMLVLVDVAGFVQALFIEDIGRTVRA